MLKNRKNNRCGYMRIVLLPAAVVLIGLAVLIMASCNRNLPPDIEIIDRGTVVTDEVATDETVSDVDETASGDTATDAPETDTVSEPGTAAEPESTVESGPTDETGTQPADVPETDERMELIKQRAVTYTGEAHEGTGIVYEGNGENRTKIIVIDAGHQTVGNTEREPVGPGATETKAKVTGGTKGTVTGLAEYELNLKVAMALRDELIKSGYTVVMIRETSDVDISNMERALIANEYKADMMIRIHANAFDDASVKGAETNCQSANNPYPDCKAVYADSRRLSEVLLNAYCESTGINKRSIKERDDLTGTNWCVIPSTVIELGFMTNADDEAYMAAETFPATAATALARGITEYYKQ